jgi:hypothetical protein
MFISARHRSMCEGSYIAFLLFPHMFMIYPPQLLVLNIVQGNPYNKSPRGDFFDFKNVGGANSLIIHAGSIVPALSCSRVNRRTLLKKYIPPADVKDDVSNILRGNILPYADLTLDLSPSTLLFSLLTHSQCSSSSRVGLAFVSLCSSTIQRGLLTDRDHVLRYDTARGVASGDDEERDRSEQQRARDGIPRPRRRDATTATRDVRRPSPRRSPSDHPRSFRPPVVAFVVVVVVFVVFVRLLLLFHQVRPARRGRRSPLGEQARVRNGTEGRSRRVSGIFGYIHESIVEFDVEAVPTGHARLERFAQDYLQRGQGGDHSGVSRSFLARRSGYGEFGIIPRRVIVPIPVILLSRRIFFLHTLFILCFHDSRLFVDSHAHAPHRTKNE